MSQDKKKIIHNYDENFEKYSNFFQNPKYAIYDLEKLIFLIDIKIEEIEAFKPIIFNLSKTGLNFTMVFIITAILTQFFNLVITVMALFTYIILFFVLNNLETKSNNQITEYLNVKKKYLLIKKCIENEIARRKENNNF
ncbi:MAG: hypothetical protein PWP62_2738 [Eubacteriaceae bacterium]|nr:hypothetical protein [Eubacteriaceae bacterium]